MLGAGLARRRRTPVPRAQGVAGARRIVRAGRIVHSWFARPKPRPHIVDRMDIDDVCAARMPMGSHKRVVMIAHDNRKHELVDWASYNAATLARHDLAATGTTGKLLAEVLGLRIERYLSGPLGGDQQIGAAIAEGRVDLVVFFWDPARAAAARRRRQGASPHCGRLQHSDRVQMMNRRFLVVGPLMDEHYTPFVNSA